MVSVAVALGGAMALSAHADEVLGRAEALILKGDAASAYQVLRRAEDERAGDPRFDYLLGVAALEVGEYGLATLAFERVLAVDPTHAAARLDMGRAHYALGNDVAALLHLKTAEQMSPPAAAKQTIAHYRQAIAKRQKESKHPRKWKAHIEATVGRDDNINQSTDRTAIYFPVFGSDLSLGEASRQTPDNYSQVAGGVDLRMSLGEGRELFASLAGRNRNYRRYNTYDTHQFDGRLGLSWHGSDHATNLSLGVSDVHLGSLPYRDAYTLAWDHGQRLNATSQLGLFAQYAQIRYDLASSKAEDIDLLAGGAALSKEIHAWVPMTLVGSAFAGSEVERQERADGNKGFAGLRLGVDASLRPDLKGFFAASVQHGRYTRSNILFERKRHDTQYDLVLGLDWQVAPEWRLRPLLTKTYNQSNVPIYDYDRLDFSVTLRRDFD